MDHPKPVTYAQLESNVDLSAPENLYDSTYDNRLPPGAGQAYDRRDSTYSKDWASQKSPGLLLPTLSKEASAQKDFTDDSVKPGALVEETQTSGARRLWLVIVWGFTWWIPSWALTHLGRMKRPDVRLAWREKLTLCILIALLCAANIFVIVVLGRLLCPNFNKAWNEKELSYHQGENDYWAAIHGEVYDFTKFWRRDHSDITGEPASQEDMITLAGKDLTSYFPVPLALGCEGLVDNKNLALTAANFTPLVTTAIHTSGVQQSVATSALKAEDWYTATLLPKIKDYHKGPYVWSTGAVKKRANDWGRQWAIYENGVYDLSDYFNTLDLNPGVDEYKFIEDSISTLFQEQPGSDITKSLNNIPLNVTAKSANLACLKNVFYVGEKDFRKSARCQAQPYLLLAFTVVIAAAILAKFLAALQLTRKRIPELRDKFVICQVPCYTEGEDSLKKTIDSLATLKYDDKRKLLFLICDGMIIGSGNDRPTPRIVLDILGVDPKIDPDPLLFKSIGEGSRQLNYGKVYSGLYECEGHVVPYIVVVKTGKPSERSRPGNRGKRDSQILLMRFLNRVHFDSEMAPLELEIYHQIQNVIGVDPKLYEFILMIDADTEVMPDSLNRLVACAADDSRIIGICGETKLSNEQTTWWTMIQVYEYYISHHLAKAFESLFGSVTCLPGCFCMYRIRSVDKGRPLIVSSLVIDDYSECNVDTLHKKNLLSLGEDRYLTTLILKHFPTFKTKFTPDALSMTAAPESWRVLLSQRRRWINSTVHNLAELVFLDNLCGFCCFSMRFVVFIDLLGTLILPATFVYLIYLIVSVSTGNGQVPIFSIVLLAAVYGLQAVIFLLKRQWQFIGWLVVYILAYPIYSFLLPIYSFWSMDDFSWGNTRVVVGEGRSKKILMDDEPYDDSIIPMAKFSDYQNAMWERGSHSTAASKPMAKSQTQYSMGAFKNGSVAGDFYRDNTALAGQHSRQGSHSPAAMAPFPSAMSMSMPMRTASPSMTGMNMFMPQHSHTPSFAPSMNAMPMFPMAAPTNYAPSMVGSELGVLGMQHHDRSMSSFMGQQQQSFPHSRAGSTYSFGGAAPVQPPQVSQSDNPTDEELRSAIKSYLSTQDLMTVTKRTARDGLGALFPNADLSTRKAFINQTIDDTLQGR
ncbi:glycosyltransferase family 2 protein [Atractiella rhizophila]|nr:glycosyltransferase family 2 protein [Atractiella rhizophila]